MQRYGCLGRQPKTHTILFGTVRFKHHHFRYPETPFLARGVQRYACLGRHPKTHSILFGTVRFKHHHFRYPETPFWPVVCKGVRVWGATPEPMACFLARWVSNTTILAIQKHLFDRCAKVWVFGAPAKNPYHIIWHGAFQTPPF